MGGGQSSPVCCALGSLQENLPYSSGHQSSPLPHQIASSEIIYRHPPFNSAGDLGVPCEGRGGSCGMPLKALTKVLGHIAHAYCFACSQHSFDP